MHRKLFPVSRLTRAIAELALRSLDQMAFSVATRLPDENTVTRAQGVARGMGYTTILVGLPTVSSEITVDEINKRVSEELAEIAGPAIVLLYAPGYDDSDRQKKVVEAVARLANAAWSLNGETFLLVVGDDEHLVDLARVAGEALGRRHWNNSIAL